MSETSLSKHKNRGVAAMSDRRRYLDSRAEARRQSLPVYSVKINGKRKPRRDLRRVARCAFGRKSREHEKSKHTPTAVPWRGSQSTRPETSREEENQTQKPAARALQPKQVLARREGCRKRDSGGGVSGGSRSRTARLPAKAVGGKNKRRDLG
jgi:hypothetical protein